ncbi:hypothetical protein KI387_015026, partial [Taxus chinensis]
VIIYYYMSSSMLGVMSMVDSNPRNGFAGLSPCLTSFMHQLPAVKGNSPDMDMVISILLQSDIPSGYIDRTAPLIPQSSSAYPASNNAIDHVSSLRKATPILNGSNMSSNKAGQGCGYIMNSSIPGPLQNGNALKNSSMSPPLTSFIRQLPAVNGPSPDADRVISVLLHSDIPSGFIHSRARLSGFRKPNFSNRDVSGAISNGQSQTMKSSKTSQPHKRRQNEHDKEEEEASEKPVMDIFRRRQIRKLQAMSVAATQSASTSSSARS